MKFMIRKKKIALIVICIVIIGGLGGWASFPWIKNNYAYTIKEFQNPFLFNNGSSVVTTADWQFRRSEIKQMLLDYEYGHMPDHPEQIRISQLEHEQYTDNTQYYHLNFSIIPKLENPTLNVNFSVWVFVPNSTGPFPVLIKVGKDGSGSNYPVNRTMLTKGYLYVCFNGDELMPDNQGFNGKGPAQLLYPDYDWGSVAVWAWGAMRVLDFCYKQSWVLSPTSFDINAEQVIVTGHSRRGKAAMLAAALDERFTMTVPSGSGCGGGGSFLVQGIGSETIALITLKYTYKAWFQTDFNQFALNERKLPFDQHFLRALIAPRAILTLNGLDDLWANPIGTQAVQEAAQPVFDFFNATENNAIHYRSGGHYFGQEDFETLLNYADYVFWNKSVEDNFYMHPYSLEFPINYDSP
jgi:hypothetical protein